MNAALPLAVGWALIILGFFNFGPVWPILVLPSLPMAAWTCFHIQGYAFAQENRDQLDTVLDMFSYPEKWVPLTDKTGAKIPHAILVWEDAVCVLHVAVMVDGKQVNFKANRAYRAKFRRKLELLQAWRQMQALVGHFKEVTK